MAVFPMRELSALAASVVLFLFLGTAATEERHEQSNAEPPKEQRSNTVQAFSHFKDCTHCPEMVALPPGEYEMGSSDQAIEQALARVPSYAGRFDILAIFGLSDYQTAKRFMSYEKPRHHVVIRRSFAIAQYPISREDFAVFVGETNYKTGNCWIFNMSRPRPRSNTWTNPGYQQTNQDPVACVTWEDAQAYLRWLNAKLGSESGHDGTGRYRMPTESEWEYAAKGGTDAAYPWGDEVGVDNALCGGCNENQHLPDGNIAYSRFLFPPKNTLPVGSFPPNRFGLYDMTGNIAELTQDCWHPSYVGAPTDQSAWIDDNCPRRTIRGSSWRGPPWTARSTSRSGAAQSDTSFDNGFRVAKNL